MEKSSKESPTNNVRTSTKRDTSKNQLVENFQNWKSSKPTRSNSNGKRTKDWDILTDRGNVFQTDTAVHGFPMKKSNMASNNMSKQNSQYGDFQIEPDRNEDEEEETEMTSEEKRDIFTAAGAGDIDLLEELLDKPNADINVIWYGENLLMAAIRSGKEEMGEFLIDNGVDINFQRKVIELTEDLDHKASVYHVGCRQMAYDKGLSDIVELIDSKNGELFPFVKPRDRNMRLRRSAKVLSPNDSESGSTEGADDEASLTSSHGAQQNIKAPLRREASENDSIRDNDTDSGHHSDISRREDVVDSPDTSFEHGKDDPRQRKHDPHDEGYCSVSPHSSRRSTPTNSSDSKNVMIKSTKSALGIRRETSKTTDAKTKDGINNSAQRKEVNAVGSYSRERRHWTPRGKNGLSKDEMADACDEEYPQALVRTQSPWQDDRPSNGRRHRRLPVPPTGTHNAQVHKPRIMSPPSQSGHRVSKILSQTKIATLPNKMSFPSLRNSVHATKIDVPGEKVHELSSRSQVRTQLKYGQSVSPIETHHTRKYDEHFVINTELVKRKKPGSRS